MVYILWWYSKVYSMVWYVWQGSFQQMWISKQEYEEGGKACVDKKCPWLTYLLTYWTTAHSVQLDHELEHLITIKRLKSINTTW